jgi:hypothetical protein
VAGLPTSDYGLLQAMDTHTGLRVYRDLADWYERQGQPSMRDRFLVLAADAALTAGLADEAERLRQRLLQANPHHLLKPYTSFSQAMQAPDVQTYVRDLRLNYPVETAESLLRTLRAESLAEVPPEPKAAGPPAADRKAPAAPAAPQAEPLKVYHFRDEEPPKPTAKPLAQPVPRAPVPAKAPAAPVPRPQPMARPAPPAPAASSEEETGDGAWFTALLFGLFITAGAALAVYVLARPFLPPEWLK